MIDPKSIRASARNFMKRHYLSMVLLCAVSIFLGAEFSGVVSNAQTWYDLLMNQETSLSIEGVMTSRSLATRLIDHALNVDLDAGKDQAAARIQALKDQSDPNAMLGRRRGALATIMNSLDTGRLYVMMGSALYSLVHSRQGAVGLMILVALAVYGVVWVFVRNLYRSILRRAFLELRSYRRMPLNHLLFFRLVRRWTRAALTLLLASVYQTLWDLTVVGGAIKHYSYFMVPFIVAENPDIPPREAITLSRRMMNGHKWECFRLEASFLGWMALGFVTFGVLDGLWSVPYRMAAFTEYYALLRNEARVRGLEGAERLNDDCLLAPSSEAALRERYADIVRRRDLIDVDIVPLPPRKRFFARNFGIWWGSQLEKNIYSRQEGIRQQTRVNWLELSGGAYPMRMNPLWTREKAALTGRVSYLSPVTVWTLVVTFFVFSIVGWAWEVSLHVMTHGEIVNRGMLHGPWLPIYGGGVVLIAVLLYRLRPQPALHALAAAVLCGCVEYLTSYVVEMSRGMRWWDYTGYFLNLNGRICAEGLAAFAVGGMVAVYLLLPIIDGAVIRMKPRVLIPACLALMIVFLSDVLYSRKVPNAGAGITDDPAMVQALQVLEGET